MYVANETIFTKDKSNIGKIMGFLTLKRAIQKIFITTAKRHQSGNKVDSTASKALKTSKITIAMASATRNTEHLTISSKFIF